MYSKFHEGRREDVDQVVAELVVAGLLVLYFAGEATHRILATAYGYLVDAGERSGENEGHPTLVGSQYPGFEIGALEAQPGILNGLAIVGYPWPGHGSTSPPGARRPL